MLYKTKGTCSVGIVVELEPDHTIQKVEFIGGCSGNTQGVASLVQGHEGGRGHLPPEGYPLRQQTYFLSRPAVQSTGKGPGRDRLGNETAGVPHKCKKRTLPLFLWARPLFVSVLLFFFASCYTQEVLPA